MAKSSPHEVDECFRRAGIRRTPQRYDVLRYLAGNHVHATADEIFQGLNRLNPRVSRARRWRRSAASERSCADSR